MPSSNDSRIIPSGVSGMFSIADSSFTPLSRSVFLWIAFSYLLRLNLSNLYTVTYFYGHPFIYHPIYRLSSTFVAQRKAKVNGKKLLQKTFKALELEFILSSARF